MNLVQNITIRIGLLQASIVVGVMYVVLIEVWVDEFSQPQNTTTRMGLLQASIVIGVTVGYAIAGSLDTADLKPSIAVKLLFIQGIVYSLFIRFVINSWLW